MARAKKEVSESAADGNQATIEPVVEPVVETAPASPATEPADDGIAELKKRLEAAESTAKSEQEARARAERERNEAVQRAYHAKNEKEDTDLRLIESALSQVQANAAHLESSYAEAITAGDAIRAAKIMREMAANEARALQLQNGQQSLKERPKEQPKPLDPVEAFAAQLSPKSAAWVRAHPEYVTNPKLQRKMIAAHSLAVEDGIPADSDDYFASVEDTLKIASRAIKAQVDPDDEEISPFSDAGAGRSRQSPAIPVSRDITPSGERTRVVRLSPDEMQMAKDCGMSPQEYWKNKEELKREGKIH